MASSRTRGHKVDVDGGERLAYSGMEFVIRASAESTGGVLSVVEEINGVDTPTHVHAKEDELFYVLEGEHVFTIDGVEHHAGPGDAVFGPRGVPHAQRRVVPRTGRTLAMFTPAGFEEFFRDLAGAEGTGSIGRQTLEQLGEKYAVTWLT